MKKINLLKKDPITKIIIDSLLNLPTPPSISYLWNIGFLLGITLIMQIITGLVLSINFVRDISIAFESTIHIIRDIDYGWVIRYTHINGASIFFIFIYIHIARGVYYNSPIKTPIVWVSGVILLLLSIITAFIGYVLPWGQISFWGATVITSIISATPYLGQELTTWIWGNFSVSQPTLNRFFSLHFILPLIITALVITHLILLHQTGSSNPSGLNPNYEKIKFYPTFLIKDITPLVLSFITLRLIIRNNPNILGDVENFSPARRTVTPIHIQPEWYFLFAYAILRTIPSKLGGVVAIRASIIILIALSLIKNKFNKKFNPIKKISYWILINAVLLLTWIGANPVEHPYIEIRFYLTWLYFIIIIIII